MDLKKNFQKGGMGMRVARIWKRRGLFWKREKSANDLDPNFHCSWISFTRFVRKLRRNFSESSGIHRFFPPKIRWSPKKKKKKRSSPKLRLIFLHKNSASKAPKTCDFAYFTSQWGAQAPPPLPLAMLLGMGEVLKFVTPDEGFRKKAKKIVHVFFNLTRF